MKIKILSHKEIKPGVKEVVYIDLNIQEKKTITLTGASYENFVKYVMSLWNEDTITTDVETKIVVNKDKSLWFCRPRFVGGIYE